MRRGQLSLSLVEAGVGVLLVVAVTATFAAGVPAPDAERAQLDRYARDAATLLANEPAPALDDVVDSASAFRRTQGALERRVDGLLPPNVLYRVETPRGSVGYPRPAGVPTGVARVPLPAGTVTVRVWYA